LKDEYEFTRKGIGQAKRADSTSERGRGRERVSSGLRAEHEAGCGA